MQLQELGLREFKRNEDGVIIESTKAGCPVAKRIPFKEFMHSRQYFTQSRAMPVNAHEVLADLTEMVEDYVGIKDRKWGEVTVYRDKMDIHGYSEKNHNRNNLPVLHPEVSLQEVAFSRIITKMPLIGDNDHNTSIAVKWEPGLCQVAVGLNVRACDNYNIFSNKLYETSKELDYMMLKSLIMKEIRAVEERHMMNIQIISQLMNRTISEKQVVFMLGEIMYRYGREDQVINVTDLTEIQRGIHRSALRDEPVRSLWDFTNVITDVLKFDRNSGDSILESISKANSFINSKLLSNAAAN